MDYKDFSEKLGKVFNVGDKVWICDYRFNNILEKPIRHIEPMQVFIVSNEDLPKNKTVYYSKVHFRPVGKSDKPTSRIIAPYDNTGYRSYTGVSLNIFATEEECKEHYRNQCMAIMTKAENEKRSIVEGLDHLYNDVKSELMKNII